MLDESLSSDGTVCNRVPKVYPEICFFPLSRNIIGGSRNKIQRGWGCDSSWYFFLPRKGWVGEDPKMVTTKMNFLRKKKYSTKEMGRVATSVTPSRSATGIWYVSRSDTGIWYVILMSLLKTRQERLFEILME